MHSFYLGGRFVLLRVLLPAWAITYYLKYHVRVRAGPPGEGMPGKGRGDGAGAVPQRVGGMLLTLGCR